MKLQIQQALATVLNIQVAADETGAEHFVRSDDPLQISLGVVGVSTLQQAVWKAMELTNLEGECNYAIFPMGSHREDYYMSIEREMLQQEADIDFRGKKMWELLGDDPRELVTATMAQLRNCATSVTHPLAFQRELIRAGCVIVASMQWVSDWIARLRMREATLRAKQPEPPKAIPFPSEPVLQPPSPTALFGATGLTVLPEAKNPDEERLRKIYNENDMCFEHDEHRPCKECEQDAAIKAQEENE